MILGTVHILLTSRTYGEWLSLGSLFFIGCGLAIILLGLMNVVFLRSADGFVRRVCLACNLTGAAFFGLGVAVAPLPQIFVLLGLMVALSVVGVLAMRGPDTMASSSHR
jgi:hypothetical protein